MDMEMEMEMEMGVYQTYFEKKNFISFFKSAHFAEQERCFFNIRTFLELNMRNYVI